MTEPAAVPDATISLGDGATMLPFAMPLLQLLARLRTLAGEADPAALRDRTEAELRNFEARAGAAGFPPDLVRRGQYALCDALDDAVLNTPWGARSAWAARPMVASLHPAIGPGRFFDALRQAEAKVSTMRPVLELMVLCLSLGTAGSYRTRPDGAAELEAVRAAASAILLAHTPPVPTALSADWKGIEVPIGRRRARLPVWVAASAVLAAAGGLFLLLDTSVNADGDALFARMLAAPPAHMPAIAREPTPAPPPPPQAAEPTLADRLRTRIADYGATDLVTVAGSPSIPVLRIDERALFPSNSATLLPSSAGIVLNAVIAAVKPEGGRLRVVGYADNRPVRTVAFPSAFKLTAARAGAVREGLLRPLDTPIVAEGRGAADPVAPNTTAEGRAANRRIEIVLDGAAP